MVFHVLHIVLSVLCALSVLLAASVFWVLSVWGNLSIYELLFEIQAPLAGTGREMLVNYLLHALLPAVLITALLFLIRRKWIKKRRPAVLFYSGNVCICLAISFITLFVRLDLKSYLKDRSETSTFIEEHYHNPDTTRIRFPEQKRNLIYIYLESMEITFSDYASGGAYDENMIPELTALALANEMFATSGQTVLNGAYSLPGTTWTMGGMVAQTCGLPLTSLAGMDMNTQDAFLPGVTAIGDILQQEGYSQELLIGSDAAFAGRDLYFQGHGNYQIHDYPYASKNGLIPESHYVYWGYEDSYLYDIAREELLEMSAQDTPFNLTMLTVDTHPPAGYLCELCEDRFSDNRYANVIACASRQLSDFITWVQAQDFYENTTIVIVGDHPTMAADFVSGIDSSYERKVYTAILNPAVRPSRREGRLYSTFDLFPTTLASLGAEITGNRLGLGVNLFSEETTLVETYGVDVVSSRLRERSLFLESLVGFQADTDQMLLKSPGADVQILKDPDTGALHVYLPEKTIHYDQLKNLMINPEEITGFYLEASDGESEPLRVDFQNGKDGIMEAVCPVISGKDMKRIDIFVEDASSQSQRLTFREGDLSVMRHDNLEGYLTGLRDKADEYVVLLCGSVFYTDSTCLKQLFQSYGLDELVTLPFGYAYAGIIDHGKISEKSEPADFSYRNTLSDNETEFEIITDYGLRAITIAGQTCKEERPGAGMLCVVYDAAAKQVVDSAFFYNETDHPLVQYRRDFAPPHENLLISVTDIQTELPIERIFLQPESEGGELQWIEMEADAERQTFTATVPLSILTTSENKLSVIAEHPFSATTTLAAPVEIDLATIDWDSYLSNLATIKDNHTIILLMKDNGQDAGLLPELFENLSVLGIQTEPEAETRSAWYAVIQNGAVTESSLDEHLLSYQTVLPSQDGSENSLEITASDWYLSDVPCSIIINGQEYCVNSKGLNIVVFDHAQNAVTDSVCYDLYDGNLQVRRTKN